MFRKESYSNNRNKNNSSHMHEREIKSPEFNMKKARYEVIRFGISGFDKSQQIEDKISIAVRLGAKPPKNKYINYKQLMEERKAKKETVQVKNPMKTQKKNAKGVSKRNKQTKTKKKATTNVNYGK